MKQYLLNFLEFNLFDITMTLVTDVLIPICTLVSISFILPNIKKHIKHNYIINIIDFIISIILL